MDIKAQHEKIDAALTDLIKEFEAESPDAGYGYEADVWVPRIKARLSELDVVILVGDPEVLSVGPTVVPLAGTVIPA